MKLKIFTLLLLALGGVAIADEPPATVALTAEQAQARQFGIFFGGTAIQYDVCAGKGFLPKGAQRAEETARAYFERIQATTIGPGDAVYVEEGWSMMRKEVTEHESFFTQEKCTGVGKEWAKIVASMKKK